MLKAIFVLIFIFANCLSTFAQTEQNDKKPTVTSQPEKPSKKNKDAAEGIVRLRVAFLASGKIGDIVLVEGKDNKKLIRAGLVDKAIEAAKLIRFEPAKKNGQPITTVRTVEYTFSIY